METEVTRALDAAGVPYAVRRHSRSVFTTEEAAQERGVRVEQICKVMIVRRPDRRLTVILIPGDRRLSLRKVRAALGERRLSMAPAEEIEARLSVRVGAISPVGLHAQLELLVDVDIEREEWVSISSGSPDAGVVLRSADLLAFLGGRRGAFTE